MLRLMVMVRSRLGVLAVFVLASAACGSSAEEEPAPLADWALAQQPKPGDTTLHLVVQEKTCNGGQAPEGRIQAEAEGQADHILVTVRVEPLEDGGTCLPNPPTAHAVPLDEPIGQRMVLNAAIRPPAPPTPPFPGFAPAR